MKISQYIILAAVLLLTACKAGDEVQQSIVQHAVTFTANMSGEGGTTRAVNVIDNTDGLKPPGTGFGVFGCYTGLHKYLDSNVHPDFMYNEHVTWGQWLSNDYEWGYSPLKYWPNGEGETTASLITGENPHYVSFMAYAPYTTGSASQCVYRFSKQGDKGDPWLEYRLAPEISNQVDLLYAQPLLDEKKHTIDERLLFTFDHALGCVGDYISINLCQEYIEGLLDMPFSNSIWMNINRVTVTYTLTEEGRLVLWNDKTTPNWQLVTDGSPTTTRTLTWSLDPVLRIYSYDKTGNPSAVPKTESETWSDSGNGVFYIPTQFGTNPQTVKLTVNYTVYIDGKPETPHDISRTFKLSEYPDGYQAGKHLYITAHICGPVDEPELTGLLIDGMLMSTKNWNNEDKGQEVYNW